MNKSTVMAQLEMPVNEQQRIETLQRYNILDTPADGSFDHITQLAAALFKVPIALITLVDTDRIWFKSAYGLSVTQINRDPGLCASAILSPDVYVVENAAADPRTMANPLVAGEFGLQFYAAASLTTADNHNLGTLCIIDKEPRPFTAEEKLILHQLSKIVMDEMDMRLALRNTVSKIKQLSSDITANLQNTIRSIEARGANQQSSDVLPYLEASHSYFLNMQNQLDSL